MISCIFLSNNQDLELMHDNDNETQLYYID